MGERTIQGLKLSLNEPFCQAFLLPRKAVVLDRNPAELPFLKDRFDPEDLRYIKRLMFIPATFRGQEASLFLSFSGETDLAMDVMMSKLIIK
jgi:hypothetical protein